MKTRAAVAWKAGAPLSIETVDLQGPKAGEVLVEIKATGICHTDEFTLSGADPEGIFPSILGHEGAGVVVKCGPGVKSLKPGDHVLVWGASGGLGVFGVQLAAASGAHAIGVISDESKRDYVLGLGAKGVINRKDFNCWGPMPTVNTPEYATWVGSPEYNDWLKEARRFGKAIWDITGKKDVDIVFEHPGEQTFPVSCLVAKRGGMVVFCAGTTGFNITFDARYVWMRQKRIQGSHFAHLKQASSANQFVIDRRVDPCMSEVFPWAEIPRAHMLMWKNKHKPGNMAVLVQAPRTGLRTFEDTLEASLGS